MSTTIKRVQKPNQDEHNAELQKIRETIDALIKKRVRVLFIYISMM